MKKIINTFLFSIFILMSVTIVLQRTSLIRYKQDDIVKIDTLYIDRIITAKTGSFEAVKPKEIIKQVYISDSLRWKKEILRLQDSLKIPIDSATISKLYLDAIKVREYTKTFKDSVLTAEITVKARGKVDYIGFNYMTRPILYKERLITKETLKTPKYSIYLGADYDQDFSAKIGVQIKGGYMFSIGRSFHGKTMIGVSKSIYTKW